MVEHRTSEEKNTQETYDQYKQKNPNKISESHSENTIYRIHKIYCYLITGESPLAKLSFFLSERVISSRENPQTEEN